MKKEKDTKLEKAVKVEEGKKTTEVLVRCFGVSEGKVKDIGKEKEVPVPFTNQKKIAPSISILNEKTNKYEPFALVDYHDNCPICKRKMHVQAREGLVLTACCSDKCKKKFAKIFNRAKWKGEEK